MSKSIMLSAGAHQGMIYWQNYGFPTFKTTTLVARRRRRQRPGLQHQRSPTPSRRRPKSQTTSLQTRGTTEKKRPRNVVSSVTDHLLTKYSDAEEA
ncbi:unnamed protein product [Ectocarpus sp. 13 AM-2016]